MKKIFLLFIVLIAVSHANYKQLMIACYDSFDKQHEELQEKVFIKIEKKSTLDKFEKKVRETCGNPNIEEDYGLR